MSATDNFNRQVIPRWRRWQHTSRDVFEFPEIGIIDKPTATETSTLLDEYRERPSLGRASDLFSAAVFENGMTPEIIEIAKTLEVSSANWPSLNSFRESISQGKSWRRESEDTSFDSRSRIHLLKKNLIMNPRNPIQWIELAREYLVKGEIKKARKAMLSAVEISPFSRTVLRASATFFWELNELEQAIYILEKSKRHKSDPTILAPMIALSDLAGRKFTHARDAKSLLDSDSFSPYAISELASALGSLEMAHGSEKRAKNLIGRSMDGASENVLAQAVWLTSKHKVNLGLVENQNFENAFEAESRLAACELNWSDAAQTARKWRDDQDFSTQAAVFGSWAACEANDWQVAISFADQGLITNPTDILLRNNAAFAYIQNSDIRRAFEHLSSEHIRINEDMANIAITATEGLLLFRAGLPVLGRKKYQDAIYRFTAKNQKVNAADARIMLSIEEYVVGNFDFEVTQREIEGLARRSGEARLLGRKQLLQKLRENSHPGIRQTETDPELRQEISRFYSK